MRFRGILVLSALLVATGLSAQELYLQNDSATSVTFTQRIYTDTVNQHTSIRPFITTYPTGIVSQPSNKKRIYRKLFEEHLLQIEKDDYELAADFLPDFQIGKDITNKERTWLNTRGIAFMGSIKNSFTFYTDFYENQGVVPAYLDSFQIKNSIIPGQGFLRPSIGKAYDYSYSSGYIAYSPSKFVHFQLGHGKHFFGDGYRSMLLSDVAFNYPYFKINTRIWKIQYTNLYAQFQDLRSPVFSYDNGFRKKYGSFHYLDLAVNKRLAIGLFEAIIWQDADSAGKRGFDVNYLNPIIFFRPVEYSVGSPDNALMGINVKYKIAKPLVLYGQFLLDEFKFAEYKNNKGWWANKYGYQAGFRYFNVAGIENLQLLSELNSATPYTYSQRTTLLNYGHYNQPLAHPLGANFKEWVTQVNYAYERFSVRLQYNYATYGTDSTNNVGKDVFKNYTTRDKEYGNFLGQGIAKQLQYMDANVSYLLNPKTNLRVEIGAAMRNESGVQDMFYTFGLRSSFRQLYNDF